MSWKKVDVMSIDALQVGNMVPFAFPMNRLQELIPTHG